MSHNSRVVKGNESNGIFHMSKPVRDSSFVRSGSQSRALPAPRCIEHDSAVPSGTSVVALLMRLRGFFFLRMCKMRRTVSASARDSATHATHVLLVRQPSCE